MATDTGTSSTVSPGKLEARRTRRRITQLFNELADINSEAIANRPDVEAREIAASVRSFLKDLGYHLEVKNFDALLLEKSGEHSLRNDGTIGYYHELIPILTILKLGKMGKHHGGFDIEDLQKYGGLRVAISTHLRHDSVEDHIGKEIEKVTGQKLSHAEKMDLFKKQLQLMRDEIIAEQTGVVLKDYKQHTLDTADISKSARSRVQKLITKLDAQIEQILINTDLMTQKRDPKTLQKEDVKDYTARMSNDEKANPIVFLLKQADVIHNFATMIGAGKFAPERRLKRVNEREDMYGHRQNFVTKAKQRWPEFRAAIRTLDHTMAFLLFPNLRYLETMDEQYFKDRGTPYKAPNKHAVGIEDYAKEAFSMNAATQPGQPAGLPEGLNSTHIFLKRILASVDPVAEPERYELLQEFLDDVMRPPLEEFKDKAPYMFEKKGHREPANGDMPQPKSSVA